MKSDSQLQQDVLAELTWESVVSAACISVEVKNGTVILAGNVANFAEKWHAVNAAQRVKGVSALRMELDIVLAESSKRADEDIAYAVQNILDWSILLPKNSIQVLVEKGWITLAGELEWEYQRLIATSAVRYLIGVTGVSDHLVMGQQVAEQEIQSVIETALQRRASVDAESISVVVAGADVTLTGTVHNWIEREIARHAALGTRGVKKVVDHMTIAY